ncbi:ABC transporter ATP-binding protein [Fontisphaera persica]|uniref:ABC transporter ATP-binding protein n=1 Tax=Fontisphaera persica TaxID=2974023 RepID=UPI0024BFF0E6|nr:ABC transporter ATP-binding protein [Fontisphaera persica]WCJ60661.1 ABC transporter ATP-binding protein [Fontisphaera persica]
MAQAPPLPAVQTLHLTRQFGPLVAVNDLNMTVLRGDLFGFIGSNGAGKTTTLRILATFLTPTSGTAKILGRDIVSESDSIRHLIGYMPDFFGVYKDMEVTEYLDFFAACYRIPAGKREKTVNDVLELVGLSDKKGSLIGALSRGMQQRLGLARVLIHDPEVLLLDEPASGLDPRARIEVMAILQELQRLGKTILISSHILSELQSLCNRVAIIEKGRLVYCGDIEGVRNHLTSSRVVWVKVTSDPEQARQLLLQHPQVKEITFEEQELRVQLTDHQTDLSFVAEVLVKGGAKLVGLREQEIGLEEVFMRLTTGETQ